MRSIEIESLDDPRVEGYRNLKDGELRRRRGLFVVEGRENVRCLIERSRYRLLSVLLNPAGFEAMRDSLAKLDGDTPIYRATQPVLREVVGYDMHRGCLALGEIAEPECVEGLLASIGARDDASLVVVLEGLANHDNVGGVFRNAMAFGAHAVLLCPRCCDPLYRKAIRTSMGATLCVPFARSGRWPEEPLRGLKRAGYSVVALDPGGETLHAGAVGRPRSSTPERTALLLGAEAEGITKRALALADRRLRIDMAEGIDSLNVATASGIALHHFFDRGQGASGAVAVSRGASDRRRTAS